jgi:hypothetical protein
LSANPAGALKLLEIRLSPSCLTAVSSSAVVTPDRACRRPDPLNDRAQLQLIYCNYAKKIAGIDSKFPFTLYFNDKAIREAQISW